MNVFAHTLVTATAGLVLLVQPVAVLAREQASNPTADFAVAQADQPNALRLLARMGTVDSANVAIVHLTGAFPAAVSARVHPDFSGALQNVAVRNPLVSPRRRPLADSLRIGGIDPASVLAVAVTTSGVVTLYYE